MGPGRAFMGVNSLLTIGKNDLSFWTLGGAAFKIYEVWKFLGIQPSHII